MTLDSGDVVSIQVFETPTLSVISRIDDRGYAVLSLGEQIKLAGLTPHEASLAVEEKLKASGLMLDPHVTIVVTQYAVRGVTVTGEVNRPGIYNLFGPHSLYDVLSIAGGPTSNEGSKIFIAHPTDPLRPDVVPVASADYSDEERTATVKPGDTVVVSKADLIYVVGDVAKPGAISIVNGVPLTILNVIGLSQGLNRTAASKHASIIRKEEGRIKTIPVNLDDVMASKAANSVLRPADILVVPRSGAKVFMEFALPALASSVLGAVSSALIVR